MSVLNSYKASICALCPVDITRGSYYSPREVQSSIIGTHEFNSEIHAFIACFTNNLKTQPNFSIDLLKIEISKFSEIIQRNKVSTNDLKCIYDTLFYTRLQTNMFNAKHHKLSQTIARIDGSLRMIAAITLTVLPIIPYNHLLMENDPNDFGEFYRDTYDNIKNNRIYSLKMVMHLMVLIKIYLQSPTNNLENCLLIGFWELLIKKNPYDDLFNELINVGTIFSEIDYMCFNSEREIKNEMTKIKNHLDKLNAPIETFIKKMNEF